MASNFTYGNFPSEISVSNMKKLFFTGVSRIVLSLLMVVLTGLATSAQVSVPFTTPGSYTWTVPAGVTSIKLEAWGGGRFRRRDQYGCGCCYDRT